MEEIICLRATNGKVGISKIILPRHSTLQKVNRVKNTKLLPQFEGSLLRLDIRFRVATTQINTHNITTNRIKSFASAMTSMTITVVSQEATPPINN